ncbi:hypothetical protein EON73_05145 [bacterium]|nr:MAG: hypothetical protein EON73_05145 [bacterium]
MERYIHRFLKVNQDIASANAKITNQNEILINEIRKNQRERARRNRQQQNRRQTARATYFRNRNENEVIAAEQRIREVFQLNRVSDNEQD